MNYLSRLKTFRNFLSLLLLLAIIAIPVLADCHAIQINSYDQGRADGERDSKGNQLWILGGFLCGAFAVIYCYVQVPTPPAEKLIGKSPQYVLGYTDGYETKRGKDAIYAWIGWGIEIAVAAILLAASSNI